MTELALEPRATGGGEVATVAAGHWRLTVPAGPAGRYRWAQLDDYAHQPRSRFAWRPPLRLSLQARASSAAIAGTWGFGVWNDPFSLSFGAGGSARRLPALPNAAWFFHAAPPNYLALRDDRPPSGFLAATFAAPRLPAVLLAAGLPLAPALAWPRSARCLRLLLRRLIGEAGAAVALPVEQWRHYEIDWTADGARFLVDDVLVLETAVSPRGPLGLVLWIDNQYAAFPPSGRLRQGTLESGGLAWLEIAALKIETDRGIVPSRSHGHSRGAML